MVQERTVLRPPYGPGSALLDVVHRMRDRGLPEVVDATTLAAVGVSEGLIPRTMQGLRFLGLIGEGDRRTDLFDRIGRATTDEYPAMLAEILRGAYAPIFTLVDPMQDNETQITDAFRPCEPMGQRDRMVMCFLVLCREAGLAPQASATPRQPTERNARAPQRARAPRQQPRAPRGSVAPVVEQRSAVPDGIDLRPLHQMIDALPSEGWWTADRRRRWLRALEGAIDYAIEEREAPTGIISTALRAMEDDQTQDS